jgi:hypothetical protein
VVGSGHSTASMYFVEDIVRGHGVMDSGFYIFVEDYSEGLVKACSWIGGEISKV